MQLALVAALALAPAWQKSERWPAPDRRIVAGPLTIDVHVSRTAHVFHVVDQLSAWDNACHGQYREHMPLSAEDEEHLRAYAEVRSKRRWGAGLEQTFYVPLDLDEAIQRGKQGDHVTAEEIAVIRPVLEHFAPRAEALMEEKRDALLGAFEAVDHAWLEKAARDVARFTGVAKLTVPAFPLASPVPGGGGMDGGRLRWEIASPDVGASVLLHELVHGFFREKQDLLDALVERTPGLTGTLLGEGFAYGFAPGLYRTSDHDELAANVAQDRANGEAWQDPTYGRQRQYALALRPLLADALATGQKLEEFLPRARDAWLALREVEEARGVPTLYWTGPAGALVRERLLESRYGMSMQGFANEAGEYAKWIELARPGDLLVITVDGSAAPALPDELARYLPIPRDELEARLRRGKTVAEEKTEAGLRVVLLAASAQREVEQLARETALLAGL